MLIVVFHTALFTTILVTDRGQLAGLVAGVLLLICHLTQVKFDSPLAPTPVDHRIEHNPRLTLTVSPIGIPTLDLGKIKEVWGWIPALDGAVN